MFTFAEKLKQMSSIEHKDVGISSLKGTPSKKIYIKTSTEAVYNPEGVTQEYINNHVDGSKIVNGTVTTGKIADNAVTMGKLDNEVQTLIQRGADSSWSPKGDFNIETTYDANDVVFDPATNSSYLSLRADNTGHPVDENDEEYEEGWWMKVLDGSYVNRAIEEMEAAIAQAIEDAQEDIDDAIAGANTAAQNANTAATNAEAKIDWVEEQVDSLTAYEVATALDGTSIIPVQNKVVTKEVLVYDSPLALTWYNAYPVAISGGQWVANTSQTTQTCNIIPVQTGDVFVITGRTSDTNNSVYAWLTTDEHDAGTTPDFLTGYTSTIVIPYGTTATITVPEGAKYIYIGRQVNGTPRLPSQIVPARKVSKLASLTTPYIVDEVRDLEAGMPYTLGEKVRTPDGKIVRLTEEISVANNREPLKERRLMAWLSASKTVKVVTEIMPYNAANTYTNGDYAFGDPDGATTICKYDGSVWTSAVFQNLLDDNIIAEVTIDWIIENVTVQDTVTNNILQSSAFVTSFDYIPQSKDVSTNRSAYIDIDITDGAKWIINTNRPNNTAFCNLYLPDIGCQKMTICFDYLSTIDAQIIVITGKKPASISNNNITPSDVKFTGSEINKGEGTKKIYIDVYPNLAYLTFQVPAPLTKNQYLQIKNIRIEGYNDVKGTISKSDKDIYAIGDEIDVTQFTALNGIIDSSNKWAKTSEFHRHILIPVCNISYLRITAGTAITNYAFLRDGRYEEGEQPDFAFNTARNDIAIGETQDIAIPDGAVCLAINATSNTGDNLLPSKVVVLAVKDAYSPQEVSHISDIDANTAKITALLGKYDAEDSDMNLQILKIGRESGSSCYWWYPHIISTRFPYKRIYHTFVDDEGSAGVVCVNAFDHRAYKIILKRKLYDGVDLHNAASIYRLPDGRFICVYSEGHNQTPYVQIRISKKADDITEWDNSISLNAHSGVCYSQFHYVNGKYYIFSRTGSGASWSYTYSEDLVTWSDYRILIEQDSSVSSKYFYIWTKPVANEPNMLRFISYGHPIYQDTGIRCGVIDFENNLVFNYADMSQPLGTLQDTYSNYDFSILIEHPNESTQGRQRMYDLAVTDLDNLKIVYGRQKLNTQIDGKYFVYEVDYASLQAAADKTSAGTRTELCQSGLCFLDHSNTHAANGLCFLDENTIFVSRSSQDYVGYDYMEIYKKINGSWQLDKEVYKELKGAELLRNAYPIASPDGRYVMWMRGYVDINTFMNTKTDLILYDVDNDRVF